MNLSIIIPTFNNVDFLDELFTSILKNKTSIQYEVLVGIDGCELTKNFLTNQKYPNNFQFFYFTKNDGPYKIKNTLSELSKYDKLFFFDSDDVMVENCIDRISDYLIKCDCIKPKFENFKDNKGIRDFDKRKGQYGEGVFGIDKRLFLAMNGFEGWKCAADSDFMGRLYKTGKKVLVSKEVLFYRRLHNNSLTKRKDTGYASSLRAEYFGLSKKRVNFGPLPTLSKNDYQELDIETYEWSKPISTIENENLDKLKQIKKKKQELLNLLFNKQPREIKPKVKQTIDYSTVNNRTNHQTNSNLNQALKKAKLENLKKNFGRR